MTELWKDAELSADATKERAFKPRLDDALTSTLEIFTVRFKKESTYGYQESVSFGRKVGDTAWQCLQSDSNFHHLAAPSVESWVALSAQPRIGVYSTVTCCDECWMCSVF